MNDCGWINSSLLRYILSMYIDNGAVSSPDHTHACCGQTYLLWFKRTSNMLRFMFKYSISHHSHDLKFLSVFVIFVSTFFDKLQNHCTVKYDFFCVRLLCLPDRHTDNIWELYALTAFVSTPTQISCICPLSYVLIYVMYRGFTSGTRAARFPSSVLF